jgi:predicted ribosome quality control (RQC) complex YloA/Tae2 family protein
MVDIYFGNHIYTDKISKIKTELFFAINKELKRINNNMKKLCCVFDNKEKAEKYRQTADTLMANLYNIKTGEKEFNTTNLYTSKNIVIPLIETLTASENAQKYYKLYNKAKNAAVISQKLFSELQKEKDYLESINYSIEQSENFNELMEVKEELLALNLVKIQSASVCKKRQKMEALKEALPLECREIDGFKVYIGKNNKQNDYIISKLSSSNDIWLHAQEIPGSHVLIKIPPESTDISQETIYNAAKLAAAFSQAKNSLKVPVIYVKRKFIKKPPGAKLGYVIYTNEKVFIVEML